jgi:conjugal transfer mating pair stabilization protein TraG
MAADIYTMGGGEIVYEVLKAVSMCLNGGGGTLKALTIIGGISGAFIVYFMMLYQNVEQVIKTWAFPVMALIAALFVPTTTVWVHDDISQFHRKLDNVPSGLAMFASSISKFGKAITEVIEQNFSLPDDLHYHKSGMIFGSDILEKAKEFKIINQNFRENMKNFVGQCVKYDIMLNHKYTFDDLRDSTDVWGLVTSNPSKSRGIFWIPVDGNGRAQYVTCEGAVAKFNTEWQKELNRVSFFASKKMFSGRAIGHSSLQGNKLKMSPQLATLIKGEFMANLQSTYSYLGDLAYSAEEGLKQNVMINAMNDTASENSRSAGNPVSYAELKALMQQNYTFETVGRLAAKVLPLMKAIIEALVYACFIFIIPLCMIPQGYKFLFNWLSTLVWLQAWAPMYAILNFIMNIAARSGTIAEIGTSGGLTIANMIGVSEANAEMKTLAGYLAISIPFICIAVVKGVGTFVHLAGQMTGATTSAAGAAAGEAVGGNLSYGNVSLGNSQMGNVSQLQRNMNSLVAAGGHRLDTGTVQIQQDASGRSVMTQMQDTGPTNLTGAMANIGSYQESLRNIRAQSNQYAVSANEARSRATQIQGQFSESVSKMKAEDFSKVTGQSSAFSKAFTDAMKYVDAKNKGRNYTSGTGAQAGLSAGAGLGASLGWNSGTPKNSGERKLKDLSLQARIGGDMGTNIQASNSRVYGSSEQIADEKAYAENQSIVDTGMRSLAASERNDDVTRMARICPEDG